MHRTAVAPTRWSTAAAFSLALLLTLAPSLAAQNATLESEGYLRPAEPIAEAILAPRHLNVTLNDASPDRRWFVQTQSDGLPTLESFARRSYNLAGLQIDPAANRLRNMTTRSAAGLALISWQDGRNVDVQVPRGANVSNATWSPDGAQIAFFVHTPNATHIHVADPATGRARQVTRTPVLATLNTSIEWSNDGRSIATVLLPEGRGAEPASPAVPPTPTVKLTTEGDNRLRTFPTLLTSPHEMQLVEYYTTGQLALIDVRSGSVRRVGRPAMISSVSLSPDAQYIRVSTMRRPFSYIVPVNSFPSADEIWNPNGEVVAVLETQPLRDGTRPDTTGQADARRSIEWRPDGRGLSFLQLAPAPAGQREEAADAQPAEGGQASRRRDRVMQWLPPFDDASASVVHESENRINSVRYSPDARVLFVAERTGNTTHEYAVFVDEDPSRRYTLTRVRQDEFFEHPGNLVQSNGRAGGGGGFGGGGGGFGGRSGGDNTIMLSSDGAHVFLSGTRYFENPEADAPRAFLDRVEIRTGNKVRVYEADNNGVSEQLLTVLDDDATKLIVSRQSPTQVPDSYLRDVASGQLQKLTDNRDYTPAITAAQRRRFEVTRVDGFRIKADITLPADYRAGTRLPALIWFYPREYDSQEAYDRTLRTYDRNRFPNIGPRSMAILTQAGYAVIEPDAPITGPTGRMNDNYVHDLRNNLAAVIDELDRQGYIDRQRLAAGGHSYGAFATVNAMVHTPFFRAGIAGAGSYNRTLTPLGFQSERRDLWEAPQVYLGMSPFLQANNLTGALFMYHGAEDQNVGTFPINSERLFHALNGLGKTASLYMYPFEDHGPATQETLLDLWARWTAWLDHYVKNAPVAGARVTTDSN
jgi:dipeptidyl aminopeptidase/acylaminoacyl peptidase